MVENRFARIDIKGIENAFSQLSNNAPQIAEDLALEAAREGAEKMKEIVETSGTGQGWSREFYAKNKPQRGNLKDYSEPGRVNTGNMRDLIRARLERGGERTIAAFGWIDALSSEDQYIRAQEYGFSAGGFRPDQTISGMFARRDARLYVQQRVIPRLIKKYTKRLLRGA